jgi:hypothetical protein
MQMEAMPSPLSSRPERTRISCHAALDMAACAPFCKGKAQEMHQRHQVLQEIRGSVVEGSAVRPSDSPNSAALTQIIKPTLFRASEALPRYKADQQLREQAWPEQRG